MKIRNFSLGINGYPASSPGSNHTTARDVLNLRVDGDGYLRMAPGVRDSHAFDSKVTGIAKAHDHLFFLLEDGELFFVTPATADEPQSLGATELRGKLSIIDDFETFFLITSSAADDPGYHYKVSDGTLTALDFMQTAARPTSRSITIGREQGFGDYDEANVKGTEFRIYYLFVDYDEDSAIGEIGSPVGNLGWFLSTQIKDGDDDNSSVQIELSDFSVLNSNATHVRVYRALFFSGERKFANDTFGTWYNLFYNADDSDFYHSAGFGQVDDLTLADFKLVHEIEADDVPTATFTDDGVESGESLTQLHLISGLPENTTKWVHFNGRNFLAGENAMRFSDAQFGVLLHSVFRASDSINAPGETRFVETLDETLVFGDAIQLHVLRGYDPFNYQVYQVASVGPVNAYAGSKLPNGGLGFIGAKGFYVFDGQQVGEISTPQLDRFFEDNLAIDGSIIPLPNGESLWSATFNNGLQYTFLLNTERLDAPIWTRLGFQFDQGSVYPVVPLATWGFGEGGGWEFDSEDEVDWGYEDRNALALEEVFLAQNADTVEQYVWHDVESGVRADNEWLWESNLMRGGSETAKIYDRLKLAGYAENDIDVEFSLDIEGETVEKSVEGVSFAKNSRKKRIPIKRRANGITFQISGTGDVLLREIELDSRVVGRV